MTAKYLGGCMRLYPAIKDADGNPVPQPRWHVDTDHHIEGIDPNVNPFVDPVSGFIHFYTITKNPILSGVVQVDESIAARSVRAGGPSNGTHLVRFRLFKTPVAGGEDIPLDLNNPVHWERVSGPYNNVWITLFHDVPEPIA